MNQQYTVGKFTVEITSQNDGTFNYKFWITNDGDWYKTPDSTKKQMRALGADINSYHAQTKKAPTVAECLATAKQADIILSGGLAEQAALIAHQEAEMRAALPVQQQIDEAVSAAITAERARILAALPGATMIGTSRVRAIVGK